MPSADEHKALGNKAFAAGNHTEAVQHFTDAIALDPSNHVLYSNRSASYASLKEFEKARVDAEKTVELKPDWGKGYSRLGAALHGEGNLEAAREAYEKGLKVEPTSAPLTKALEDVKRAIEADSQNPFSSFLNEGIWAKIAANPKLSPYLADRDYCSKLTTLIQNPQMAMNMMSDQRITGTLLTLMGINVGNPDDFLPKNPEDTTAAPAEATATTSSAARSRSPSPPKAASSSPHKAGSSSSPIPPSTSARSSPAPPPPAAEEGSDKAEMLREKELGNAAYKKREFDVALQHYDRAWELSQEQEVTILTNKAAVYFEKEDYPTCIETCQKAIDLAREQRADYKLVARALARIGNAYVKQGELEQAIVYYNKSLTEHRIPDTLTRLRDTEKALKEQKKAAYHDPALADAARDRGNALFKEQKFAEAVKEYAEAIARNEDDARNYSNRAACYHKLGAFPEALKDCDQAIAHDAKFVKAYIRKAALLFAMKEYRRCLSTCDEALTVDEEAGGAHQGEIMGQMQKARQALFAANNSSDPKAREEQMKRAMQDPEVREILQDPAMKLILQQLQTDPQGASRAHLSNPQIAQKIAKLMEAGILTAG